MSSYQLQHNKASIYEFTFKTSRYDFYSFTNKRNGMHNLGYAILKPEHQTFTGLVCFGGGVIFHRNESIYLRELAQQPLEVKKLQ